MYPEILEWLKFTFVSLNLSFVMPDLSFVMLNLSFDQIEVCVHDYYCRPW